MNKGKWPPEIVYVEWVDSVSTQGWSSYETHNEQLASPKRLDHVTCGYLVKSCSQYVAVAHSVGIGIKNVCDPIQIPRRAITKIRRIKDDGYK